ncbi:oligoendopeptidase F [Tepidibacter aestuarii]|uniref:oligoendopeptidase F n=1 Tax=Tepidibacter aestuarii TaxID=2925782 RepID=UPI0020C134C8|nr:oligoendopeptidase F [Tepidibacter aestuarii]CAH2214962.1 Oligoendopeptidase F homolog [Tepidibacter aestuarii]
MKVKKQIISVILTASIATFPLLSFADQVSYTNRSDIPKEYTWSTEDIYLTDNAWEEDFKKLEESIPKVESYKGKLKQEKYILEVLNLKEEMFRLEQKLYVYASLKRDEDNSNEKYSAMADRAEGINTKVTEAFSFVEPEILSLSEEKLKSFTEKEEFEDYDVYLNNLLRTKQHSLSQEGERILALASDIGAMPETIYSKYDDLDRKAEDITLDNGKTIKVTYATYSKLLDNPNRDVRKKAFESMFKSYEKNINTIAANLSAEVKTNIFFAKSRNYNSALEGSLDSDNIKPEVYNNIVEAVNDNLEPLHRYVSLRKKILGIEDKVRYYDMYVSMVKQSGNEYIDYEKAKNMVKEALYPLGDNYIKDLDKAFQERWVDVYENENKSSGAYSWGTYDTHPYVLLNYNGTLDSVSTLAHELGHAMNSYYSNKTQPYSKSDYPIFTAEVASTTNEALMLDYLIKNAKTKEEKMYLINSYLEQIRGSIYTQIMYAEFEKTIHEAAENGEALTSEFLNKTWGNLMSKYYGEDFEVDDLSKVWWSRIPHFYYNFYVYKYATGLSSGIILSENMINNEEGARDAYLEFLASGGNDYPVEMLKKAGVDMTTTEPVEKALQKFDELLTELENLMNE